MEFRQKRREYHKKEAGEKMAVEVYKKAYYMERQKLVEERKRKLEKKQEENMNKAKKIKEIETL